MGISKASASRCVHSFTQCLKSIAGEWIIFPTSREEVNIIIDIKFYHSSTKALANCEVNSTSTRHDHLHERGSDFHFHLHYISCLHFSEKS